MAAPPGTSCSLVGPVPFKDWQVVGDERRVSPPEDREDIISSLPSATALGLRLRQYQGVWLPEARVPGILPSSGASSRAPATCSLASPPKCGTAWLKALSFATMARARTLLPPRSTTRFFRLNPHECVPFMEDLFSAGQDSKLDALPSPRLMQTHVHHSLLPAAAVADDNPRCKIVYVCREPKDMLVSLWHFLGAAGPWAELLALACEGKNPNGPIWSHVLGYWRAIKASPEKVMFLRYEEMLLDPVGTVGELARFLGVPFTAAEAEQAAGSPADVARLCSFETLKGVSAANKGSFGILRRFENESFFRKGVVGDWANHLTPEMAQRFDAIFQEKLRG